jgi:mono/diheme cytochrome c family protein
MLRLKLLVILAFAIAAAAGACSDAATGEHKIASDTSYEASLFRQNCAICHGTEGEGKTLDDGTVVPSLRAGEFKKTTENEIYNQIADGGNGMLAFRRQLTDREIRLLTDLIRTKLRSTK